MKTCSMDFKNKDFDISFYVFKPTVEIVDHLVHRLQHFSLLTQNLGCVQSSIFRSIHGNMQSMLANNVTGMAVLVEHNFLDAYAGESRDGSLTVKFSTGDIISMDSVVTTTRDLNDLSYAALAIFRSRFPKIDGIVSGLCMKGQCLPCVVCIHVWQSLQFCYSWILHPDHRKWMMPYLERFSTEMKYDIFRVVYVSGDNVMNLPSDFPHRMLEDEEENTQYLMQQ
ncbi:uncharacterized protein LOC106767892 isoform X3 [Vigna radiata var. radiata]|uniref:Uncharacterized protein LOC106767892 isoform X3 n=1 Tax=Vigna radiata var. radiata TaxID=3916 RepID=A0A3Q0F8H8_VIGRR|nr:uncharacterized protein LOC106767892 isoform X3 [Vigna radiata var. radiata]